MGFNKKVLSKAVSELGKAKAPGKPKDIIVDPRGYWNPANQGEPVRVPGGDDINGMEITMHQVSQPIWAQPNVGPGAIMYPEENRHFPGASYVDETPIAKKGGTAGKLSSGNKTVTKVVNIKFDLPDLSGAKKIDDKVTLAMSPDSSGVFTIGKDVEKFSGIKESEVKADIAAGKESPEDAIIYGLTNVMNGGKDVYLWINGSRLQGMAKKNGADEAITEVVSHEAIHLARHLITRAIAKKKGLNLNNEDWIKHDYGAGEYNWPAVGDENKENPIVQIDEESFATAEGIIVEQILPYFKEMAKSYLKSTDSKEFKKGGTLQSKKYSKSMSATNKLMAKNKLFQNKKSKIFDPNAEFQQGGIKTNPWLYTYDLGMPNSEVVGGGFDTQFKSGIHGSLSGEIPLFNRNSQPWLSQNVGIGRGYKGLYGDVTLNNSSSAGSLLNPSLTTSLQYNKNLGDHYNFRAGLSNLSSKGSYFNPEINAGITYSFKKGGSKLGPINLNPNPLSHYELNYGFNLPVKQDGGESDYEELELTPEEIQAYRDGGYVVEEIPEQEIGGYVQHEIAKAQKGGSKIDNYEILPETFNYEGRPGARYRRDNYGNWLVADKNTNGKFVAVKDKTGKRQAELNKNAISSETGKTVSDYELNKIKDPQKRMVKKAWNDYNNMSTSEKVLDRVQAGMIDPLGMISRAVTGKQAYIPGMGKGVLNYENPEVRNNYLRELGYTPGLFDASDIQNMVNPMYWGASAGNQLHKGNYGQGALELGFALAGAGQGKNMLQGSKYLMDDVAKGANYAGKTLGKFNAKKLPGSPSAVNDVQKAGFDGNFLTRPLTLFTKNELLGSPENRLLYRKIGNAKGLQHLIDKGGAQAPAPMRMTSGTTIDTPFFGPGSKPNENYRGLFAVEIDPANPKYKWSNYVAGTQNKGVAPYNPETGELVKNIPLEDLNVYKKKWFSNNYKKLKPEELKTALIFAKEQALIENAYKWGVRGTVADQIFNDGNYGKAIQNYFLGKPDTSHKKIVEGDDDYENGQADITQPAFQIGGSKFKRTAFDEDAKSNVDWQSKPVVAKKKPLTTTQKKAQKTFDKNFKVTDKSKYEKTENKIASEQQKLKDWAKEKGIPITDKDLENVADQQWSFAGVDQQDIPGPDMIQATPEQSNYNRAWEYMTNPFTAAEYAISGGGAENMPHNINEMRMAGIDPGVVPGRNMVGNMLNTSYNLIDAGDKVVRNAYRGNYGDAALEALRFVPSLGLLDDAVRLGVKPGVKYLSKAMNTAPSWLPGATINNALTAGFAGHGLNEIVSGNVAEPWKKAMKSGKGIDYATALGENAMTALELAPIVGPAAKGLIEGLNASKESGLLSKVDKTIYPTRTYRAHVPGGNETSYEASELSKKINKKGDWSTKDLSEVQQYLAGTEAFGGKKGLLTGNDMLLTEYKVPFWKRNVAYDKDVKALKKLQNVDVNPNEYIVPNNKFLYPRRTNVIKAVPEELKNIEEILPSGNKINMYSPHTIPFSYSSTQYASKPYKYIEDQINAVTGHDMPLSYKFNQSLGINQKTPMSDWTQKQFAPNKGLGKFNAKELPSSPSPSSGTNGTLNAGISPELIKNAVGPRNSFLARLVDNAYFSPLLNKTMDKLSPLNLIPGYGSKLTGATMPLGNVINRSIKNGNLVEAPSLLRQAKNLVKTTEAKPLTTQFNNLNSDIYAAKVSGLNPGSTIGVGQPYKQGFLGRTFAKSKAQYPVQNRAGESLSEIPLSDSGVSLYRRLPFSKRYVPIDKEKLMNNQFQWSTTGAGLQNLGEKFVKSAPVYGALGAGTAALMYNPYDYMSKEGKRMVEEDHMPLETFTDLPTKTDVTKQGFIDAQQSPLEYIKNPDPYGVKFYGSMLGYSQGGNVITEEWEDELDDYTINLLRKAGYVVEEID